MLYFWRNMPSIKIFKSDAISLKKNVLILQANVISLKKNSFCKKFHISSYLSEENSFFTFHYSTRSPPSGIKQPGFNPNNLKYSCSTSQKTHCVYTIRSLSKKTLFILWRVNIAKIQYMSIYNNFYNVNASGTYSSHFSLKY
jgi:hypothetical protein